MVMGAAACIALPGAAFVGTAEEQSPVSAEDLPATSSSADTALMGREARGKEDVPQSEERQSAGKEIVTVRVANDPGALQPGEIIDLMLVDRSQTPKAKSDPRIVVENADSAFDPPTFEQVVRALPDDSKGGFPFQAEVSRKNIQITVELIVNSLGESRFYPNVGEARHHRVSYKCMARFDKTIRSDWPIPYAHTDQVVEVVYIDQDRLISTDRMQEVIYVGKDSHEIRIAVSAAQAELLKAVMPTSRLVAFRRDEDRKSPPNEFVTLTYSVADLVVPVEHMYVTISNDGTATTSKESHRGVQENFTALMELIQSCVAPDRWEALSGLGSMMPYRTTLSLVVRQTRGIHDEIADVLSQLRRLRDLQATLQIDVVSVPGESSNTPLKLENDPADSKEGVSYLTETQLTAFRALVEKSAGATLMSIPRLTLFNGQGAELKLRRRLPVKGTVRLPTLHVLPIILADRSAIRLQVAAGATQPLDALARNHAYVIKNGQSLLVDMTEDFSWNQIAGMVGVQAGVIRRQHKVAPTERLLLLITSQIGTPEIGVLLENRQIAATVNGQPIFVEDILRQMPLEMADLLAWTERESPEQYQRLRREIVIKHLELHIECELLLQSLKSKITEDALKTIQKQIDANFRSEYLPHAIKMAGFTIEAEFEEALRKRGSSIETLRTHYRKKELAQQYLGTMVLPKTGFDRPDLLKYYDEHKEDFVTSSGLQPFAAVQEDIKTRLKNALFRKAAKALLDDLREKAAIERFTDKL